MRSKQPHQFLAKYLNEFPFLKRVKNILPLVTQAEIVTKNYNELVEISNDFVYLLLNGKVVLR